MKVTALKPGIYLAGNKGVIIVFSHIRSYLLLYYKAHLYINTVSPIPSSLWLAVDWQIGREQNGSQLDMRNMKYIKLH